MNLVSAGKKNSGDLVYFAIDTNMTYAGISLSFFANVAQFASKPFDYVYLSRKKIGFFRFFIKKFRDDFIGIDSYANFLRFQFRLCYVLLYATGFY